MKIPFLLFFLFIYIHGLQSQTVCTTPGQNPSSAFPVCGTSTFTQSNVPLCGGRKVPNPACASSPLFDVNPFWYKFTCFTSGTLGFTINPHSNAEDYDWQIFDVTNHDLSEVYTNVNLVISSNWSGESGLTGASTAGTKTYICEGYGQPLFSKMPDLIKGHNYLLLISHFTNTQSGYDLSFKGGTAVITDTTQPKLQYAVANCAGNMITVKLNKPIRCSSLAPDGSDFSLSPALASISAVKGIGCDAKFDTDSLQIFLNNILAPGNYKVVTKNGNDGNTLLDYCDNGIAVGEESKFQIIAKQPTPMDSILPPECNSQKFSLIFKNPIICNSIANDGSDFTISGPYPVTITSVKPQCNTAGSTKQIDLILSKKLSDKGHFTIILKKGTDGNTLLDECSEETPAGSTVSFDVKDTVNADFTYSIQYGCNTDTIQFHHPGGNEIIAWSWQLDEQQTGNSKDETGIYNQFTTKKIKLNVSNGFCSDSSFTEIPLNNFLKSDFTVIEDNCPNDEIAFHNISVGRIISQTWDFADGATSTVENPTHNFPAPFATKIYNVILTVTDNFGCQKQSTKPVKIYSSCYLAIPTAFTPNNDGKNDLLHVLNAVKTENFDFKVFNRWGQLVFTTNDWKMGWDGTLNGKPQPTGVYIWFLKFSDRDTHQKHEMKGTSTLIR